MKNFIELVMASLLSCVAITVNIDVAFIEKAEISINVDK